MDDGSRYRLTQSNPIATSSGHRKSHASTRRLSQESERQNSSAACWNLAAPSTAQNATHENMQFESARSAIPPVSTTKHSHHSESVQREMHEQAEQAKARARAAYEQNRAALDLISKSLDNVMNTFTKARRVRNRFHDLLSVSSRSRRHARRRVDISTRSVRRAEGSATDNFL